MQEQARHSDGQKTLNTSLLGTSQRRQGHRTENSWYVLRHHDPTWVERMLQREYQTLFSTPAHNPPLSICWFIPYLFLSTLPAGNTPEEIQSNRNARSVLRCYVFVQTSLDHIMQLLGSDWNHNGNRHMTLVCSHSGVPQRIPDSEMQRFIATLSHPQRYYQISQPLTDLTAGDSVTLNIAPWEGRHAVVTRLRLREDGHAALTVSMEILGNLVGISFPDISDQDVTLYDPSRRQLLNGQLLSIFEQQLLAVLGSNRDSSSLRNLWPYRHIQCDKPDHQLRLDAIMLVCAHLLNEQAERKVYLAHLQGLLPANGNPTTDAEAYIALAIFVTTHDPNCRDAVQHYLRSHDGQPEMLRRMFGRVKRMRCR